jgi:hypothetical protein
MKDERLTGLGQTIQKDFRVLLMKYATGWFAHHGLGGDDFPELRYLVIEVRRFIRLGFDFADLERALTSGFFPVDLVGISDESEFEVAKEYSAVSPAFPEVNPRLDDQASKTNDEQHKGSKKHREFMVSDLGQAVSKDFQESIGKYISEWFDHQCLTKDDLQELRKTGTDIERFIDLGSDFAELGQSLTAGFFPMDLGVHSNESGFQACEEDAPICSRIAPKDRRLGDHSFRASNGSEKNRVMTEAAPISETESISAWNHECHSPVKGLRELAQFLESEQNKGIALLSKAGNSSGSSENDVALNQSSKIDLPDSSKDFSSEGDLSDNFAHVITRSMAGDICGERRSNAMSSPGEEDGVEMIRLSKLSSDCHAKEGSYFNDLIHVFEGPIARDKPAQERTDAMPFLEEHDESKIIQAPTWSSSGHEEKGGYSDYCTQDHARQSEGDISEEEHLFAKPFPEEADKNKMIQPAMRSSPGHEKRSGYYDDLAYVFERLAASELSAQERPVAMLFSKEDDSDEVNWPPMQRSPCHREREDVAKFKRQNSRVFNWKSFDTPEATRGDILRNRISPRHRPSSYPCRMQESAFEVESRANENHKYTDRSNSNLPEIDVDLILEELAQRIYREYKRFYGS